MSTSCGGGSHPFISYCWPTCEHCCKDREALQQHNDPSHCTPHIAHLTWGSVLQSACCRDHTMFHNHDDLPAVTHLPVLFLHCCYLPCLHRPDEQAEVGVGEVNCCVPTQDGYEPSAQHSQPANGLHKHSSKQAATQQRRNLAGNNCRPRVAERVDAPIPTPGTMHTADAACCCCYTLA